MNEIIDTVTHKSSFEQACQEQVGSFALEALQNAENIFKRLICR